MSNLVVTLLQSKSAMPLARRSTFAIPVALVALGVGFLGSAPAAISEPHLRSATRPGTGRNGALLPKNVRLTEPITLGATAHGGGYRVRTRHTLPAGRYYVQVSALVIGVDCTPHKPCPTRWSNILRVRVPRR